MRRLLFFGLAVVVVIGGGYLFLFKRGDVVRAAKGYKKADTPQAAADMFKRAVEKREYDMAAHYCTAGFAEQLVRGSTAAAGLGEAIDNLTYQMKERSLIRDEVKVTLYALDPFPKDVQITVGKENGDTAEATMVFAYPLRNGNQPTSGTWNLKAEIFQVFIRSMRAPEPDDGRRADEEGKGRVEVRLPGRRQSPAPRRLPERPLQGLREPDGDRDAGSEERPVDEGERDQPAEDAIGAGGEGVSAYGSRSATRMVALGAASGEMESFGQSASCVCTRSRQVRSAAVRVAEDVQAGGCSGRVPSNRRRRQSRTVRPSWWCRGTSVESATSTSIAARSG